jgi:hypothetical protein
MPNTSSPGLEPGDVLAVRLDTPGDISTANAGLGHAEPVAHDADEVRQTGHQAGTKKGARRRVPNEVALRPLRNLGGIG